jgi:hypothetical protein
MFVLSLASALVFAQSATDSNPSSSTSSITATLPTSTAATTSPTSITAKDPAASLLAAKALAAMSALSADQLQSVQTIATGSISILGAAPQAITLKTRGTSQTRIELATGKGTITTILNADSGQRTSADSKVRRLREENTLGQRVTHIPALSLIAEAADAAMEIGAPDSSKDSFAGGAALSAANSFVLSSAKGPGNALDAANRTAATRATFTLDPVTGLVTKLHYRQVAENDSNYTFDVDVEYSDYRIIGGLVIPFKQRSYVNGKLESELLLSSAAIITSLTDSDFALVAEVNNAKN